ncbi:MAG: YdeI/OmpD-associated family protein [Candidatus Nanopelagicales bacterium]
MRFRGGVVLGGKTATGIQVPERVVESFGSGKRPRVAVTLNGAYTYRTTVAAYGDEYWIPLAAEHREAAGLAAGDDVDIDMELDTAPRVVEVPDDLQVALDRNPAAKASFEMLSYSNKRRHVLAIDGAKTPQTRHRRIDKVIDELGREA